MSTKLRFLSNPKGEIIHYLHARDQRQKINVCDTSCQVETEGNNNPRTILLVDYGDNSRNLSSLITMDVLGRSQILSIFQALVKSKF